MANLFLVLILVIALSMQKKNLNIVQVFTFHQYPDNKVTVFIGDQPIQFKANIDMINQNSCFVLNKETEYQSSVSSIITPNKQLTFKNITVIGKQIDDLFSFEDDNYGPQVRLRFDLIDDNPSLYYLNRISLPFVFKDESYSIIHQIKSKGIIHELAFSRIKENIVTHFYFGGMPDGYFMNGTFVSYCNVIGINGYWDCLLNKISIRNNNEEYTYKSKRGTVAIFDFGKIFIYAPSNYIDFLMNHFFKEYLDNKDCSISGYSFRWLSCKKEVLLKMGELIFVIEEFIYKINLETFFKCSMDLCFLEILDNPDGDYWRFGSLFFEHYDVLFHYERKKVFFYSTEKIESYETHFHYDNNIIVYVVCGTIMICGIALMLILRRYSK